jgi:hypothetical protein
MDSPLVFFVSLLWQAGLFLLPAKAGLFGDGSAEVGREISMYRNVSYRGGYHVEE